MENQARSSSSIYWKSKRNVRAGVIIFTVIANIFALWFEKNPPVSQIITFFTAIGYGIFILLWCSFDSRERNEDLGAGFRILLVIFGAFALLFYLFKSRGFKKGLISIGYLLLFLLILVLVNTITIIIFEALFQT
jgi:hypothetical protein